MSDAEKSRFNKDEFEAFLQEEYGITRSDLDWMRNYRRTITKYGDWVAKAVVTSMILGLLAGVGTVLWLGIKQALATLLK